MGNMENPGIRYIISEDVHYKQVNHQVLVQRGTIQKYFPVDESLLLLIYQAKMPKSIKYEIS